jgi:hypothetical protein
VSLSKSIEDNWPAIVAGLFAVAALSLGLLSFERSAIAIPPIPSRDGGIMPPTDWKASAAPGDVLDVPGYNVAYWGRPVGDVISRWNGKVTRAGYSSKSTAKKKRPIAVIIHYTRGRKAIDGPIVTRVIKTKGSKKTKVVKERLWKRDVPEPYFSKLFVKYQHNGDPSRKGNHFGYHVYAFPSGDIVQGAPLSVRTNHIKPRGHRLRRSGEPHSNLDNDNSIGVSATAGCKLDARRFPVVRCISWQTTASQEAAIIASVKELQSRFGMSCRAVYGHGELQKDRRDFEGSALAKKMREAC